MQLPCISFIIQIMYRKRIYDEHIYCIFTFILTAPVAGTLACDVAVTENGVTKTLAGGYTYDATKTADITGVSPARGGTGGGTVLTITGTGFG